MQPAAAVLPLPASRRSGVAAIEFAIVLPVLVLLLLGVWDMFFYIEQRTVMNRIANQTTAVLSSLTTNDISRDAGLIDQVLDEASSMGGRHGDVRVEVRFCEYYQGAWYEIFNRHRGTNQCGITPNCEIDTATARGYGAFVQANVCLPYQPAILPTYFTRGSRIETASYQPLLSSNQTERLVELNPGRTPVTGGGTPTGPSGHPYCKPGQTSFADGSCGTETPNQCPTDYQAGGQGDTQCHSNPTCLPSNPTCTQPCPPGGQMQAGQCVANACPAGQFLGPLHKCVANCSRQCGTSLFLDYDTCSCQKMNCEPTEERLKGVCVPRCNAPQIRDPQTGKCA